MRYWSLTEMSELLSRSGFQLICAQEWITGKEVGDSTWGAVVTAKKIKA